MDQERNPNKNAELSMEQNGNMIDGIINNLPVPPRSDLISTNCIACTSATYERGNSMVVG